MPRIVDHDERRAELAAAACEAIFRIGIDNLKLTDVGDVAGCTTGTITHYFANKDELTLAALDYAWSTTQQKMAMRLAQDETDVIGFLSQLLPISRENQVAVVVWYHYWLLGMNSPLLAEHRQHSHLAWISLLETVLIKMQQRGEIRPEIDVSAEVIGVDAIVNGIALQAILDPEEWPAERQLAELRHYFARLQ